MSPVAVQQYKLAGKTVTDIAAGNKHTCAVASASVYCWGNRIDAALGDYGGNTGIQPTPVSISSTTGATQISASLESTCATINSKAYCWGANTYREAGTGTTAPAWRPTAVVGITGSVTKVVTGANATCAVADGKAYCWGYDQKGELGILNPGATLTALPVTALDGTTVTDISLGSATTCAIADGSAYCWGYNAFGQVGDGTTTDQWLPVKILDGGVKLIATGSRDTLALRTP
jgi:alpha-tubulin suppressor-like RCC1 family protein